MTDLEEAVWQGMVEFEDETFSSVDFVPNFSIDNKKYKIAYGTFRNIISKLLHAGLIQVAYYSPQAFYCIIRHDDTVTDNHTGIKPSLHIWKTPRQISNDPLYRIIQNTVLGKRSLHDIRLRFAVKGIWTTLSTRYKHNPYSKDLILDPKSWKINDLDIKVSVHTTDTVGVTVGCSYYPIVVDVSGVVRLSNALSVVKERLSNIISTYTIAAELESVEPVPDPSSWIVTMWHFGSDALVEYTGEKFYASWEVSEHALLTAYIKEWQHCRKLRLEGQEYPQKSLELAIAEKLDAVRCINEG